MKFSIFGYKGFIGSQMSNYLKNQKIECELVDPDNEEIFHKNLGHVIYAIGVTGDFRERYFDTVESHVCVLHKILKNCNFESFLYLSSTRVYSNTKSSNESDEIIVNPNKIDNLYNISKLMGESLCMSMNSDKIKISRLSNVVGNTVEQNDLLSSISYDIKNKGKVIIHIKENSEKDYIHVDDVVKILKKISIEGKEKIYNVAHGENIKISEIVNDLKKITKCEIEFSADAIDQSFPKINIKKIQEEFNYKPISILSRLKDIIDLKT